MEWFRCFLWLASRTSLVAALKIWEETYHEVWNWLEPLSCLFFDDTSVSSTPLSTCTSITTAFDHLVEQKALRLLILNLEHSKSATTVMQLAVCRRVLQDLVIELRVPRLEVVTIVESMEIDSQKGSLAYINDDFDGWSGQIMRIRTYMRKTYCFGLSSFLLKQNQYCSDWSSQETAHEVWGVLNAVIPE